MKKLMAIVFVVSAAGLGAAGYKNTRNVYIGNNYATGSLGTARNSSDTSQMIGCYVYANEAYGYKSLTCSARDAAGNTAVCYTDAANLVDIGGRINGDSYLAFYFNSVAAADCMTVQVSTYSYDLPKL